MPAIPSPAPAAVQKTEEEKKKEQKEQTAMEKGFKQAEKTWGGKLPAICQETIDASRKLFDDYYER